MSLLSSAEDSQQRLDALTAMKAMFDNICMYPDLVAAAQMWDGKTEIDAVGMALNRGMQEAQEYEAEAKMSVEGAEAEANHRAAEEATGSLFGESFSVIGEELSRKEVQGIAACMEGLLGEGGKGVIHNEAVGDMSLVAGRTGKRGRGLQHMAEHRLFQGFSLEEIGRIITYALKAVDSVEHPDKHGMRLIFDRFGARAVAATNPKEGNPVITGFVLDTNNEKGAVDSDAAFLANHFYALDELSRIQEVGAAVRDGIAHLEHVVKNYPLLW